MSDFKKSAKINCMLRIVTIFSTFIFVTDLTFGQAVLRESDSGGNAQDSLMVAAAVSPADFNDAQLDDLIAGADPGGKTKTSPWSKEFTLLLQGGYNDNVLQGAFAEESSPFISVSLEGFLWKISNGGRKDSYWYLLGEQYYYPDAEGIDKESLVIVQNRVTWNPGQTLSGGYKFTFTYADEVFDISRSDLEIESTTLEFKQFDLAPFARWSLSGNSYLQLEGGAQRNYFLDSSDDYTDPFARLTYQKRFSFGGKLELGFKTGRKIYDERTQRDEDGFSIEDTELQWQWHEASVVWKQDWMREKRLQTTTKLAVKLNRDNGMGYSDYDRYKISQKVRLEKNSWSLLGEFNYSFNHYAVQTVDFSDDNLYQRYDLSALVRINKNISEKLNIFVQWSHDNSRSNRIEDEFKQNGFFLGIERKF